MTQNTLLIIFSLFLLGCASIDTRDIEFISEANPGFHLNGYGSYAWGGSAALVFDINGRWEPPDYDLDAEIKFLIDTEMRDRGLVENSSNPDLILGFATIVDIRTMQLLQDPDASLDLLERTLPLGALNVTFVDARTGYVVWMGVAIADIDETPDPELSRKRIQYAVSNMLDLVPE